MTYERRIRNNKLRRQRQLKRKIYMFFSTIIFIIVLSVGGFAIGSKAQAQEEVILYKYYTNIEVQYGDTLWEIANKYFCKEKYQNYKHYISEVKRINGLHSDKIVSGSYLIVPYYSSEYK